MSYKFNIGKFKNCEDVNSKINLLVELLLKKAVFVSDENMTEEIEGYFDEL